MLIDWFTVIAQAINFLILMWLLKRFLYKPVLKAIDAREERIAATVGKAEDEKRAAEREHAMYRKKNEDFELERAGLLAEAQAEARDAGRRLFERERQNADDSRDKWRRSLADEQRRFGDVVVRRVQAEVFAILRSAFSDLADTNLEARMVEVFDRRLRGSKDTLGGMVEAAPEEATAFVVKSAFDLSDEQREALRKTFAETTGRDVDVRFQTEANLIGGVELIVNGRKIAWTLGDYLGRLEGAVSELLDVPDAAVPAGAAEKTADREVIAGRSP
jgi:F-type H+-transporting ATPase subunit b